MTGTRRMGVRGESCKEKVRGTGATSNIARIPDMLGPLDAAARGRIPAGENSTKCSIRGAGCTHPKRVGTARRQAGNRRLF